MTAGNLKKMVWQLQRENAHIILCHMQRMVFTFSVLSMISVLIWASSRLNLPSGFPT